MTSSSQSIFNNINCPKCDSAKLLYDFEQKLYVCKNCHHEFEAENKTSIGLRIFLSYGHDQNEELVRMIKAELEKRGHDVWFDKSGVKESGIVAGDDWRRAITDGITNSNRVLSFLSKHSTRDPGVCLDEIAIAIGVKGGNIQTILVESEIEVKAPPSISHIQWLDMHDWKEKRTQDGESWETWYRGKLNEIIDVVESNESRRFAGEIEKLNNYLKPISSDSRIKDLLKKGFIGRIWLTDAIEKWRTNVDRSSRLFWIIGNPGVGKSAFSAHLSHFGKDKVIAAQFCEYDKPDHRDAARVICSLAFQLATRLPDYRKMLLTLPEINRLETKGESELFDYLFTNPLKQAIAGGRERYMILIDALDEAKVGERNPLVEMLAQNAPRLPEWLSIVVTSRPEKNVTDPLQGLKPFILDTDLEDNKEDICQYLEQELSELLNNRADARDILEQILLKSEGVFLYVEKVCTDLKEGNLSLDSLMDFPIGLGDIYLQFFQRQFPDPEGYRRKIRPALRAILAAMEPLPVQLLGILFSWKREELNDFTRILGSLFPVLQESEQKVIRHYHKSIVDWITNESTAGAYFIDLEEGHHLLADYGWQKFLQGPENMEPYFIKWLPRHLLKLKRWDNLVDLLCNLEYIQEKAAAKLTYHLVEDFNLTLQNIPDNVEDFKEEIETQARMDKYIHDLVACAKGEIIELKVPETKSLRSDQKMSSEIERLKTNPSILDRLKDFKHFLGREAGSLQDYSIEFAHFATQQAWNYADSGIVKKEAEKRSHDVLKHLLLHSRLTCPRWNPLPQEIHTLKGHSSDVHAVSITPDGQRAISGSKDNTCIIWEMFSGKTLLTLKGHDGEVHAVSLTPDGKRAISGSEDCTCIVWDLKTGLIIHTLRGHTAPVYSVAITPEGNRAISGSLDSTCIIWDLNSGLPVNTLKGHNSSVLAVDITADGKKAFSGSYDTTCILWDVITGQILNTLKSHNSSVNTVAITPDGKKAISGSSDKTCIIWDLLTGQALKTLIEHKSNIESVDISPDGKRAISGSSDQTCIIWDLRTGHSIKILKGHADSVFAVAITADGERAISGSRDKSCIIWDLNNKQESYIQIGHTNIINDVAFTPDGKKGITGSTDSNCIIWNLDESKVIHDLKGHSSSVNAVNISSDGSRAITVSYDNTGIIWNLKTGNPINILDNSHFQKDKNNINNNFETSHADCANFAAITSDDKKALFATRDYALVIWDLETAQTIGKTTGHSGCITTIAITPDAKLAVTGSMDHTCIIWDLISGQAIHTLVGHSSGWIKSVAITSDGKKAISCSFDNTCIIWDLNTCKVFDTICEYTAITVPFGNRIVYGSNFNSCLIYDLEKKKKVMLFIATSSINIVSWFPGGVFLGTDSGKIYLLNVCKNSGNNFRHIVTIKRIWDFELRDFQKPSIDCPQCGERFLPSASVLETIEMISGKSGLRPDHSPCLDLPEEAWEEPELLSYCPKCSEQLKLNPFIAG
jgi:WD40 repeat protein